MNTETTKQSPATRAAVLMYGIASYALFFGVFAYLVLFTAGVAVPKGVDDGATRPLAEALLIDVGLIALFGVQHSVMARARFKRWWTSIVPPAAERSTFVLASTLVVAALLYFWVPMPGSLWHATSSSLQTALWVMFGLGWGLLLVSTFLIDHFELFGLRQVWAYFRRHEASTPAFKTPGPYRWVRHPMMLGIVVGFWATPHMTMGHLVLALGMTGYVLVGTALEERDLLRHFGRRYAAYRERVPMLVPLPKLGGERSGRDDGEART